MLNSIKKKYVVIALAIGLIVPLSSSTDRYFEISKNLEIFTTLFKELNTLYVDEIDPNELMEIGIHSMLESLDPYTNYMAGAELDNYQLQTTGKYGGIGARIGMINEHVTITEPYEGFPAFNAGLKAGDELLEIDGKEIKGFNTEEVSQILRGQPGSSVKVKFNRPVVDKVEEVTIVRGEVKINNVPYFGVVGHDVGYIKLSNFSEKAGKEVQDALQALKDDHDITGVILDLRGNGGGLLHEAINVSNVFIDKGVEIVSTKGKMQEANHKYQTLNKPTDLDIPLVVLTDGGSASASEIVSGSIQDLDRGVIVGQRTFGKGLVQITRPIAYKSRLKVTTSKYYIPSGRCIQAIDYSNRHLTDHAEIIPDSLRQEFKTKSGRKVLDGAGIEPDVSTDFEYIENVTISLFQKNHIFNYATVYQNTHDKIEDVANFKLSDAEYDKFLEYLTDKDYDYSTASEKNLEKLEEAAKEESYYDAIKETLEELSHEITHDKENDLVKHKDEIMRALELEIANRYGYQKGRIAASLTDDADVDSAVSILKDNSKYAAILAMK